MTRVGDDALMHEAILLGVDTCGASGSLAVAKVVTEAGEPDQLELLHETFLAGGEYAATLVGSVAVALEACGIRIGDLAGIVVVAGPGSFTGIRIGLAAVKAFAEVAGLPVIAVSRLAMLAATAKAYSVRSAVLDAHRGQLYCGLYELGQSPREMLLTAGEINSMGGLPQPVAVCEESVAQLLETLMEVEPVRVAAPTAWNAIEIALGRWEVKDFADVASLDGYYLRGADAKLMTL